jgi:hypothetical protein
MIQNSALLDIDLNARNNLGQSFVHNCHTERGYAALEQSGLCDCAALDLQGRDALECAIAAGEYSLATYIYQRRVSSGAAPLRVFYAVVDLAYKRLTSVPSASDPQDQDQIETDKWVKLAEYMYRDSTSSKRLAPIDQLDEKRIKAFCKVFETSENGRNNSWSRSPYRVGETLFEAVLRISMGRMLPANGLRCLIALAENATEDVALVSPSRKGYSPLHVLAESDLCSLIDDDESVNLLTVLIDLLLQQGFDPEAKVPQTQRTALDMALEKSMFPPSARAMDVFLTRLVSGLDDGNSEFHAHDVNQAVGDFDVAPNQRESVPMQITDQFFERGPTQGYRGGYDARQEEHDTDEDLRMALLLSLQESQGSSKTTTFAAQSDQVEKDIPRSDEHDPDNLQYDEDEMISRALATSLENLSPDEPKQD